MLDDGLIVRFGIALAIGLVVGVERGWRDRDAPTGSRTAGVRTYGLGALLGAVAAEIGRALASPMPLAVTLIVFATAFAFFKLREVEHDREFSVTSVVAALLVFGLGALCVVGDARAAAAGGVATAGILASREFLHRLLTRLTWPELRSALLLLAMTIVVLPLLPDRPLGSPTGANPREIWLFTVLTAGISFAGYLGVKLAGPTRGVLISGLAGALVSSTAVTVAFARRAAAGEPAATLAGGAALAGLVSALRALTVAGLVAPSLLVWLAVPTLAGAAGFGSVAAILLWRRTGPPPGGTTHLGNPFDLAPLLGFAGIFTVVAFLSGWLTQKTGASGLLVTSGVLGLVDVDVAVLTAARLVGVSIEAGGAALAILLALAVNAVARTAYAWFAGPPAYAGRLSAATAAALGVAAVAAVGQLVVLATGR